MYNQTHREKKIPHTTLQLRFEKYGHNSHKLFITPKKVRRPVIQKTAAGLFIKRWDSCTDAAKYIGRSVANICYAARGKAKKGLAFGYKWEYEQTKIEK